LRIARADIPRATTAPVPARSGTGVTNTAAMSDESNEKEPVNQDFRLFWTGQATSAFGSALTTVALPLVSGGSAARRHAG
jgi:hypothetical protein